jgi:hypothetical protein
MRVSRFVTYSGTFRGLLHGHSKRGRQAPAEVWKIATDRNQAACFDQVPQPVRSDTSPVRDADDNHVPS